MYLWKYFAKLDKNICAKYNFCATILPYSICFNKFYYYSVSAGLIEWNGLLLRLGDGEVVTYGYKNGYSIMMKRPMSASDVMKTLCFLKIRISAFTDDKTLQWNITHRISKL